jgi:colanic acid/amylovoran biosynthesis protein
MKYNKAFISAYVAGNLGDDLFIEVLCKRYPHIKFTIMGSNKYREFFSHITNLNYIGLNHYLWKVINRFELLHLVAHFIISRFIKLNILVTGSIFEETEGYRKNIRKKKINIRLFKEVYYLSCSMGSYKSEEFLEECRSVFSKVKDVCFRDNYSFNLFKDLRNVRVKPDLIFQLQYDEKKVENNIVISVIDLEMRDKLKIYEEEYLYKLKETIIALVDQGYKIVLMGFCENERDHIGIDKVYSILPENCKDMTSKYMHKNIKDSLEVLSKSKGIIATRFHSFILAYVMKKPMYNIIYSTKTLNAINDLGIMLPNVNIDKINDLNVDSILDALQMVPTYSDKPIIESKKQFSALDEVLKIK